MADDRAWLRGEHYLRFGYRVTPAARGGKHWAGGPARHEGARCPACRRPWLLLWDIDCTDSKFRRETRTVFEGMTRLPLYFCWTCSGWMSYAVVDDERVKLLARDKDAEHQDDWPYEDYPRELPRRALTLEPIPDDVEKRLLIAQEIGDEWLTDDDRATLSTWLGQRKGDLHRQQLGGLPHLAQGHEKHHCVRPGCRWRKDNQHFTHGSMKVLASIHNDTRWLPMIEPPGNDGGNEWVQVVFWICPGCLSIRADQRAD